MDKEDLKKPIDYGALYEIDYNLNKGDGSAITELKHVLKTYDIKTLEDICKFCSNPLDNMYSSWIQIRKEDGRYFKIKNKLDKLEGKEYYAECLKILRRAGKKNIGLLLTYLESEGFDFSKEYLRKFMGFIEQ